MQLLPLPPALWTQLPGRELVVEVSAAVGLGDHWRAASLSPSRTLNSLFALGVPLAALALAAIQPSRFREAFVWLILGAGAASAMLGLLQLMGPPGGALYLYRITNDDVAVGLFANRNHHAVFLASLIPLLGYVAVRSLRQSRGATRSLGVMAAACGALFIVPLILVTGSRAGMALGAVVAVPVALLLAAELRHHLGKNPLARTISRLAAPIILAGLAGIAALTHLASRSLAFDRLLGSAGDAGLRGDLLPYLWQLAVSVFPRRLWAWLLHFRL